MVDLPDDRLGQTVGTTIFLDASAAGLGWFVDPIPADNAEFVPAAGSGQLTAPAGSQAEDRVDLLTALAHEIGHVLAYDHAETGVMAETLATGTRRLPHEEAIDVVFGKLGEDLI